MANTLTFANQTITDANIFGGINFVVDLNIEEEFTIGNTASASVSFDTDIQLPLYTKDSTNGQFIWEQDGVARGRYYITEVTKMAGRYTITAYDAMCLLGANVSALGVVPPATASVLANNIAAYMGCTVSGTIKNGSLSISEFEDDLTIRGLLSYIAEASGCSVKIDNADHLCFMYYADSGITVSASEYIALEVADYTCAAIDNVTIFNSEGEIQATAGSGSNSLYIGQNPFLEEATNTHATNIYNSVKNFVYAPLTCEMFERNGIEVGTIATFGGVPTLVMHIDSGEGGTTVSSVGSDARAGYNKDIITTVNETRAIAVDAQAAAASASSAAIDAQNAASAAQSQASAAASAASSAQSQASAAASSASAASSAASAAQTSANRAQASADNAGEYAARALGNLASVQSVAETLAWITAHGTMTLTTDTALDPSHVYFVRDTNGDYTVGSYKYSVVSEPVLADISTYYELGIDESLNNYVATHLAVDSEGLWIIPDSGGNKVLIATGGTGHTYETAGTYIVSGSTVLASFTADGAQIGQDGDVHIIIDEDSFSMVDSNRTEFAHMGSPIGAQITDTFIYSDTSVFTLSQTPSGAITVKINGITTSSFSVSGTTLTVTATLAEGDEVTAQYDTAAEIKYYTMGVRSGDTGEYSVAEGNNVIASGSYSHAEGLDTAARGNCSHAEGCDTAASGENSHAEGSATRARGDDSHAEGYYTYAIGSYSHAEGVGTNAIGRYSHAEGSTTTASGRNSHAEGSTTTASGNESHAGGCVTIAQRKSQTAIGEYNEADTQGADGTERGKYVFIIGNGTSDSARSNALAVKWDGNVEMALDTSATSGTDKEIYDALVSLGWDSDVIV